MCTCVGVGVGVMGVCVCCLYVMCVRVFVHEKLNPFLCECIK